MLTTTRRGLEVVMAVGVVATLLAFLIGGERIGLACVQMVLTIGCIQGLVLIEEWWQSSSQEPSLMRRSLITRRLLLLVWLVMTSMIGYGMLTTEFPL